MSSNENRPSAAHSNSFPAAAAADRTNSQASSNGPLDWYYENERQAELDGRGDWPSSSSSEAYDEDLDDNDSGCGRSSLDHGHGGNNNNAAALHGHGSQDPLNPLGAGTLEQSPTHVSDTMRHLLEDRAVRWKVMVAAGLVKPDHPGREGFLAGEIDSEFDMEKLKARAAVEAAAESSERKREKARSNNPLIVDDSEDEARAPRTLRVVNGSVNSSSSSEASKGKGKAKAAVAMPSIVDKPTSSSSNTHPGTSSSGYSHPGSSATSEHIAPMDHWQTEARRIGMPLTTYPTNPITDYHYQDRQMDAVNTGLYTAGQAQGGVVPTAAGVPGGTAGSKAPKKRPSIKDFLRRPFTRSTRQPSGTGSYLDRLFHRRRPEGNMQSVQEEEEAARQEGLIRQARARAEVPPGSRFPQPCGVPVGELARTQLASQAGSSQHATSEAERGRMGSSGQASISVQGSSGQASPGKNKSMTFRGQIERYD